MHTVTNLHNGILCSHKRNEVLIPETLWVNQENIILSESSQTPKATRDGGRSPGGWEGAGRR